jgi:peptide/nickel transport system substrate-binding protein
MDTLRAHVDAASYQGVAIMDARSQDSRSRRSQHRRWLSLAVLLAIMAVLVAVAVTACGESEETPSGGKTPAEGLQSTTPAADGTVDHITWNLNFGEPTTIDPIKAGDYGPCFVSSQLHDTLVRYSPEWELGPGIAEKWDQVDDLTLVYTIRQDAKFWDGNPVTADDVLYSLQRCADWDTGSIWASFFDNVKSMKKTGPWEITVKFSKPDELFNKEMGTVAGGIVEKAYVEKVGNEKYGSGTKVMGSGPYKITSWESGKEITLEAMPTYWDANLIPKVATATLTFISDTSTITSAILSGEIDGAYSVPVTSVPTVKSSAPGTVYYGPSLWAVEVAFANGKGILGDPDVRMALAMAVDRQAIVDKVFNGLGVPNKTLTPPSSWDPEALDVYQKAYDAITQPDVTADVEGAKALLEGKTGLEKPLVMAIDAGNEDELRVASVFQQAAKDIGITIKLKPMQAMDMANVFYVAEYRKGLDLVMTWGWLDCPDPLDYTVLCVMSDSWFNWIGYSNPEMEALLVKARETFDPVQRAELVCEAQTMYTADTVMIPLVNPYNNVYMNDRISGAPTSWAYMWLPDLAMLGGTQ